MRDRSRRYSRWVFVFKPLSIWIPILLTAQLAQASAEVQSGNASFPHDAAFEIREAVSAAITVGDGVDELLEGALAQQATQYGMNWWQVLGTVLAADQIVNDLLQEDFEAAMHNIAKYSANQMLSANRVSAHLAGSASISRLAVLPIEITLSDLVDAVSEVGFQYQKKAYFAARSEPFMMSHTQIVARERTDPTITYDDFGYLRTVGTLSPPFISRPDARFSSEDVYAVMRLVYETGARRDCKA